MRRALLLFLAMSFGPASAETLVISVSTPRVAIVSNFSGADLVVFGAIDREGQLISPPYYDVVITIRGPGSTFNVRRRMQKAGLWIDAKVRQFREVPTFMAILSTRSLEDIGSAETLRSYRLSFVPPSGEAEVGEGRDYLDALIRLQRQAGRYVAQPGSIVFLSPTLFRATLPLPPNVPLGIYQVEARLFVRGDVIASQKASLEIIKRGFDEMVAEFSRTQPLVYGLATALMSLLLGWLATVVLRRD